MSSAVRPSIRSESRRTVAVIDIGTTSVRMAIAEIDDQGGVRTLGKFSQALSLGKDTFTHGVIAKTTIEECVQVLKTYRQALREYQITSLDQVRVIATSAVREATNRLAFIDRLYIATGMQVEPLDEAEVNRLTYLAIEPFFAANPTLAAGRTIIVEIGGGSTELLVMRGPNVTYSHTYRLGSLRLRSMLQAYQAPTVKLQQIMETQILKTVEQIRDHVTAEGPQEIVALGGEMRFAASQLIREWNQDQLTRISVSALARLANKILALSEDRIIRQFHLSGPDAETLGPALLANVQVARTLGADSVLVASTTLRDGLLREMSLRDAWNEDFVSQIVRSAVDLGRRFTFDESHARHVANLAKSLFEQLRDEHQLDNRWQIILYLAALLHEIGQFVSSRSFHKHSMYLIQNSELFGLGNRDVLLVALVARYHRRASPKAEHEGYATLSRDERVVVAKLAAILRVAIALDDSRSQRIHEFRCEREPGRLVISVPAIDDVSLEQLALRQSGTLFEETYGMPVMLRLNVRDE